MDISSPEDAQPSTPLTSTGIPGLDNILRGGLASGQIFLIEGDPGTGKTTLAMQFIREGTRLGESCLYVTFSESRGELLSSSRSHGWSMEDLPIIEIIPGADKLQERARYTVFHPTEIELATTTRYLIEEVERVNPNRLVIDSLSEFRLLSGDAFRYRRQLLALRQFLGERNATVLLLDDRTASGDSDLQLHSVAHGVIRLEKLTRTYGATRRRLEIIKVRGSAYREGFHDYTIHRGGMEVYPRLIAAEHGGENAEHGGEDNELPRLVTSNVAELDLLFGGGLDQGASTLIVGPTGVGKSSFALMYAAAATQRGERALYYTFDEAAGTIRKRAHGWGMNIDGMLREGALHLQQVDPAELSPGEFVSSIQRQAEQNGARLIVLDSLNGFLNAMPGENDLLLQMHELLAFLNQKKVSVFLVLTQQGLVGTMQVPVDISYLADNLLLLRFFEFEGSVRQAVSALKKRTGHHERTIREFTIDSGGIHIGAPLSQFRGVLTGVPEYFGSDQLLKRSDGFK